MSNINRDYLVIIDVKSGSVNKPTMVFYNTDKNTSNIYAQLVVKETIVNATPIENATDFTIELKVVKPGNVVKFMDGVLVNEAEAIYEFDLPEDFTNLSGNYDIEFWVKAKVNDRDEMITSSKAKYTVKASILTDLDEAIEDHEDYPLFLKLMEEVKVINETAHELDTTIRTLQSDMIEANNEMKANEEQRKANEVLRETNEANRVAQENAREEYLNAFDGKWEEYKANTDTDIADYKAQINAQEVAREQAEATREANEQQRIANENDRIHKENRRESQERERVSNEYDRQNAEQSREYAEIDRVANEEIRQTNEANREAAEAIRKANEQARIVEHEAMRTEHEQTMTAVNEVKAENAILMENDKKIADRMTQVEISDKRQYVIMEGLMNSAGDGYLKIEDTGNDTTLYNSVEGFVDVKNITGNTMVNSIKNPDDELTLNADINTSGQSVTLTTAVDSGQVDILAEGNTMVNVCDQQEAVAITKSYTVETGNHVALQGEFDGKARPIPTGNTLVNIIDSFGSVINAEADFSTGSYKCTANGTARHLYYKVIPKTSTTYTAIAYVNKNTINNKFSLIGLDVTENNSQITIPTEFTGLFVSKFTTKADNLDNIWETDLWKENTEGEIEIKGFMILEGDYTNKPIPDYFTGMKSSFEDKVVTQEMVDSGEELAENLGKYRVDYKVTGKNKFDVNKIIGASRTSVNTVQSVSRYDNPIKLKPNTTYIATSNTYANDISAMFISTSSSEEPSTTKNGLSEVGRTITTDDTGNVYIMIRVSGDFVIPTDTTLQDGTYWIQIEEGTQATAYEPYKSFTKTYYLNSPLLEGDTIEESGGNVYHVHRSEIVAYTEGDESTNITDLTNTLKTKSSPTYEPISQSDSILTDSYVAGHLDFDTAVPVEKVVFSDILLTLKYLYSNTNYIVQFESDNAGILDKIGFYGNTIKNININKGLNKIAVSTGTSNKNVLYIQGIGFNASNIVVTEATDKDFGYFQGMKSVGELEGNTIEIVSANGTDSTAEGYLSNSKQILLNEPLRAVGYAKDRFVQIDGKWYVERNCAKRNYETDDETNTSYKTDKVKTVYTLPSPTYEPVEIAPTVNTYTDVTHITNNSTIPMNMPIVNSGYEVIAKPSTKYTVVGMTNGRIGDSTIVNGTITTPATITDNFLRPYGTGTTSKVMLLEGEPANIPGYFTGIKSVFEDKVTEDGKYACEVRVYNDLGNETKQTLYLDEPLYNTNNITIYNNKLGYWKNWDKVVLDGSDDEGWAVSGNSPISDSLLEFTKKFGECERLTDLLSNNFSMQQGNAEGFRNTSGVYNLRLFINKAKLQTQDLDGFKQWLQANPVTVVYQLAEPVFVPLIDNCPNWVIGSWDNCSIHFDSIIPLKDTRYRYTGNVPSVMTMSNDVAEAKSISDQQDSLLVDMATELAVMKLTM